MDRSRLHTGEIVFINTLKLTSEYIGANNDMKSLIGHYIDVHSLSRYYHQGIKVLHPKSGELYTIHCGDISFEPILKHPRKIIRVGRKIQAKFDVDTLSV